MLQSWIDGGYYNYVDLAKIKIYKELKSIGKPILTYLDAYYDFI